MNEPKEVQMLCPFLITTVFNSRFSGNVPETRSSVQRMQPCMKEQCMMYSTQRNSCKRV